MSKKIFIIENYDEEKNTEKVNFNLIDILFRGNPTGFISPPNWPTFQKYSVQLH